MFLLCNYIERGGLRIDLRACKRNTKRTLSMHLKGQPLGIHWEVFQLLLEETRVRNESTPFHKYDTPTK